MTWAGRRALVTGAGGFIGSWLTRRLLDEGAEVVALLAEDEPRSELVRSGAIDDVTPIEGLLEDPVVVERAVREEGVDTVFHLGAQTIVGVAHRDPVATFEANVRGSYLLLDACRRSDGTVQRVVVASSDKAYGASEQLPYTEDMPLAGLQPYEVSKSCTDLIAQTYAAAYALPVAIARCGNVYGGGDLNWSRLVPGTVRSLIQGEVPVIRSDGTQVRDYLHVDDVVEAYVCLAAWLDRGDGVADGRAFNFSDERPRTVLEVYDAVAEAFGATVPPQILGEASTEIPAQHLDSSRARRLLGWKAQVSLEEGLPRTIDWYRRLLQP